MTAHVDSPGHWPGTLYDCPACEKIMDRRRWIMYVAQNFPGNVISELGTADSLADAREQYAAYCHDVYNDDCHATLYPYSPEGWAEANTFAEDGLAYGCPFDYPSYLIERGPRGGVRVEKC